MADEERDSADVAEEFVARALTGGPWETRDSDGQEPCWVERGVGDARERFLETPLSYLEACKIESLLMAARGDERTSTVRWAVFSHRRDGSNDWCEWISLFTEEDGREALAEYRRDYAHYEVELRKVTTTEERVDA